MISLKTAVYAPRVVYVCSALYVQKLKPSGASEHMADSEGIETDEPSPKSSAKSRGSLPSVRTEKVTSSGETPRRGSAEKLTSLSLALRSRQPKLNQCRSCETIRPNQLLLTATSVSSAACISMPLSSAETAPSAETLASSSTTVPLEPEPEKFLMMRRNQFPIGIPG